MKMPSTCVFNVKVQCVLALVNRRWKHIFFFFHSPSSDRFISICLMAIVDGSSFTWRNLFNRYHITYSMKLISNFALKLRNRIYYGKRQASFHLELLFRLHLNDFLRSSMSYSNCITVIFSVEFNKSVKHIVITSHPTCIHPTGCQTFQISNQPRNTNRKWKCDSVYSILDLVRWMWEFEIHWWKMIAQILDSRCKVERTNTFWTQQFLYLKIPFWNWIFCSTFG